MMHCVLFASGVLFEREIMFLLDHPVLSLVLIGAFFLMFVGLIWWLLRSKDRVK